MTRQLKPTAVRVNELLKSIDPNAAYVSTDAIMSVTGSDQATVYLSWDHGATNLPFRKVEEFQTALEQGCVGRGWELSFDAAKMPERRAFQIRRAPVQAQENGL